MLMGSQWLSAAVTGQFERLWGGWVWEWPSQTDAVVQQVSRALILLSFGVIMKTIFGLAVLRGLMCVVLLHAAPYYYIYMGQCER